MPEYRCDSRSARRESSDSWPLSPRPVRRLSPRTCSSSRTESQSFRSNSPCLQLKCEINLLSNDLSPTLATHQFSSHYKYSRWERLDPVRRATPWPVQEPIALSSRGHSHSSPVARSYSDTSSPNWANCPSPVQSPIVFAATDHVSAVRGGHRH